MVLELKAEQNLTNLLIIKYVYLKHGVCIVHLFSTKMFRVINKINKHLKIIISLVFFHIQVSKLECTQIGYLESFQDSVNSPGKKLRSPVFGT